uniref:Uncharacterized protein n=1 Tax=viral metagenome TaxID=1070528 RepID=A0A6M3LXL2_9ZZZZ
MMRQMATAAAVLVAAVVLSMFLMVSCETTVPECAMKEKVPETAAEFVATFSDHYLRAQSYFLAPMRTIAGPGVAVILDGDAVTVRYDGETVGNFTIGAGYQFVGLINNPEDAEALYWTLRRRPCPPPAKADAGGR